MKSVDDSILRKYSASFMSDSKWRKLFSVVNESNTELSHCVWKLVSKELPLNGHLPDFESLGEDFVGDCGALNGPFSFQEIEWLFLPTSYEFKPYENAPLKVLTQSIDHIVMQLNKLGKFEYEKSTKGLKIYGYKP